MTLPFLFAFWSYKDAILVFQVPETFEIDMKRQTKPMTMVKLFSSKRLPVLHVHSSRSLPPQVSGAHVAHRPNVHQQNIKKMTLEERGILIMYEDDNQCLMIPGPSITRDIVNSPLSARHGNAEVDACFSEQLLAGGSSPNHSTGSKG